MKREMEVIEETQMELLEKKNMTQMKTQWTGLIAIWVFWFSK